ncbi:MAG: DUF4340 domain-containing protein, partial [Kiritimatiellaceae bacterium]|nr:DUF4340 domain-containing protein [Kiritimatiellaceae bacterium]
MKARSTVVLLASVVLLGAFIWIQESWRAKQSVRLVREIRLFNLNVETLNSITFTYTNGVVRCVKENGEWMAGGQDGKSGKADLALMMHMVAGLNSMGKGTKITSKQLEIRGFDAAQYGFDKPLVNIEAIDNEGLHQWQVGRKTPLGDMVYAKTVDDEDIYTISDKLLFIVPTTHDHLRDRVLFPGEAAGVRRVEIRGPSGFVQLLKDPSTGWRLQQPVAVSADPKEVNEFIEKLYLLRIGEFVA